MEGGNTRGKDRGKDKGARHDAISTPGGHQTLPKRVGKLPVTEISDEDYRSFCWPCYNLEEAGEGQPGE